jgi:hypothetical protein
MTPQEQNIIVFLVGQEAPALSAEIKIGADISMNAFAKASRELLTDGYIETVREDGVNLLKYTLTPDGLSVGKQIIRHRAFQGEIVPPRKPTFKPWEDFGSCYQRNQGLKHIQSVGTPC